MDEQLDFQIMSNFLIIGTFCVFCCTVITVCKNTCFDKNKNIRYIRAVSEDGSSLSPTISPPPKYDSLVVE